MWQAPIEIEEALDFIKNTLYFFAGLSKNTAELITNSRKFTTGKCIDIVVCRREQTLYPRA